MKKQRKDGSNRSGRPVLKTDDTVSQLNIPSNRIAMITKSGQIILKMSKPLRLMTEEERQRLSLSWVNDGHYNRKQPD